MSAIKKSRKEIRQEAKELIAADKQREKEARIQQTAVNRDSSFAVK